MLRVLGRETDVRALSGFAPVTVQDTLCRQPSVRYAVVVTEEGEPVAAAEAWPGGHVDVDACRAALGAEYGRGPVADLHILPVDRIPRTEQCEPDRTAIRSASAAS